MNTKSLLTKKAILTIAAIASVAIFANLTLQGSEAATVFVRGVDYPYAEGIQTIATFTFVDGVESIKFPIYTQTNTLLSVKDPRPSFDLQGVVGDYPLLHAAVDEAKKYGASVDYGFNYDFKFFDVDVSLVEAGKTIRAYQYSDCKVTNYTIDTLLDKEEGYFMAGKKTGWVITDKYSFECEGFKPINPALAAMDVNNYEYKTTSTMAYELKQSELQKKIDEFQLGTQTKGQ